MKPIVVNDTQKFDKIIGRLIATPPEKQKDMKLSPKPSTKR